MKSAIRNGMLRLIRFPVSMVSQLSIFNILIKGILMKLLMNTIMLFRIILTIETGRTGMGGL
jgi:hypothetical protein